MGFFHDVRIALRSLLRAPAFGITTVLIVGLGIGMASGMVTVFRAVLLAPLPVHDQERLVVPRLVHGGGVDAGIVASELDLLQRESRTLRSVGGADQRGAMVFPMMDGDRPVVLAQALATGNFFEVLGVRPALGRFFRPADDVRGAPPVMVISYRAWQREFGGDPGVIGRQITEPVFQWRYRIIGVAPPGLDYPLGVDYWVPAEPLGGTVATLVARLAPGVTRAAAGAELRTLMQGSPRWSASPDQLVRADVQPFVDAVAGGVRPALVVLTAAVALLLLIACVNVGNLLLLRAASRARDLAVRRALGASAGNLLRHLLAESGMLAVGGLVLGLVIAVVILRVLIVVGPAQLPRSEMITLAGAPIGTAVAATLVAFLLFGVVPGVLATRGQLAASLRLGGRSGHLTRGHRRLRHVLVGAQVALALILLAGAGLLTRSLARLEGLDLGYRPEHLSIIELAVPREVSRSVLDQVQQRLRAVPGVTGVTPILVPPFIGTNVRMRRFAVEGQTAQEVGRNAFVAMESAGEQYFTTLDIPVLRGRGFTESDWEEAPMVAVVSQSVAQRFWPGRDPIGQRIRFEDDSVPRTVIGIAGDVNFRTLRESAPTVYLPWRQTQMRGGYLAARTRGRPVGGVRCDAQCRSRGGCPGDDVARPTDGRPARCADGAASPERTAALRLQLDRTRAGCAGTVRRDGVAGARGDARAWRAHGARSDSGSRARARARPCLGRLRWRHAGRSGGSNSHIPPLHDAVVRGRPGRRNRAGRCVRAAAFGYARRRLSAGPSRHED